MRRHEPDTFYVEGHALIDGIDGDAHDLPAPDHTSDWGANWRPLCGYPDICRRHVLRVHPVGGQLLKEQILGSTRGNISWVVAGDWCRDLQVDFEVRIGRGQEPRKRQPRVRCAC